MNPHATSATLGVRPRARSPRLPSGRPRPLHTTVPQGQDAQGLASYNLRERGLHLETALRPAARAVVPELVSATDASHMAWIQRLTLGSAAHSSTTHCVAAAPTQPHPGARCHCPGAL